MYMYCPCILKTGQNQKLGIHSTRTHEIRADATTPRRRYQSCMCVHFVKFVLLYCSDTCDNVLEKNTLECSDNRAWVQN